MSKVKTAADPQTQLKNIKAHLLTEAKTQKEFDKAKKNLDELAKKFSKDEVATKEISFLTSICDFILGGKSSKLISELQTILNNIGTWAGNIEDHFGALQVCIDSLENHPAPQQLIRDKKTTLVNETIARIQPLKSNSQEIDYSKITLNDIVHAGKLLELEANNPEVKKALPYQFFMDMGAKFLNNNNNDIAKGAYDQAQKIILQEIESTKKPNLKANLYCDLAALHFTKGEYKDADAACKQAVKFDQNLYKRITNAEFLLRLAKAAYNPDDLSDVLKKAIVLDPSILNHKSEFSYYHQIVDSGLEESINKILLASYTEYKLLPSKTYNDLMAYGDALKSYGVLIKKNDLNVAKNNLNAAVEAYGEAVEAYGEALVASGGASKVVKAYVAKASAHGEIANLKNLYPNIAENQNSINCYKEAIKLNADIYQEIPVDLNLLKAYSDNENSEQKVAALNKFIADPSCTKEMLVEAVTCCGNLSDATVNYQPYIDRMSHSNNIANKKEFFESISDELKNIDPKGALQFLNKAHKFADFLDQKEIEFKMYGLQSPPPAYDEKLEKETKLKEKIIEQLKSLKTQYDIDIKSNPTIDELNKGHLNKIQSFKTTDKYKQKYNDLVAIFEPKVIRKGEHTRKHYQQKVQECLDDFVKLRFKEDKENLDKEISKVTDLKTTFSDNIKANCGNFQDGLKALGFTPDTKEYSDYYNEFRQEALSIIGDSTVLHFDIA